MTEALSVLTHLLTKLEESTLLSKVTQLSQYTLQEQNAAKLLLKLSFSDPHPLTNATNRVTSLLATPEDDLTGLPEPHPDESESHVFILGLTALFTSSTDLLLTGALCTEEAYTSCMSLMLATLCPSNIRPLSASYREETQTFSLKTTTQKADLVFVVDNSSSMDRFRTVIPKAASELEDAASSSSLDLCLGVITTDSDLLSDSNQDGAFTQNFLEFKEDLKAGSSGHENESGIFFAEKAMKPKGTFSKAKSPREGASLSFVMITDEPDHYSSHSGTPFNMVENLFFQKSARVHAIVKTDSTDRDYGKTYIELASRTGGRCVSIDDQNALKGFMEQVVHDAETPAPRLTLTQRAMACSIQVKLEESPLPLSPINGWTFDMASNAILFHGKAIADTQNGQVVVTYTF
ncbi:MAG: VWA domain-containing protein [Desulfobacterales bacterium]|nr:VWA domain-containing protein [Desulfobacterales bacterium]